METKHVTLTAIAALALASPALAGPTVADAAAKHKIAVHVGPDPLRPAADPDTGKRPDPYVRFRLTRAVPGGRYRIVVEQAPKPKSDVPCNPGLTTQWHRASDDRAVAFPLEPVGTGTYFPFAGYTPCHGSYVMRVHKRMRSSSRWTWVRSFAFKYPSFAFSYVPVREGRERG